MKNKTEQQKNILEEKELRETKQELAQEYKYKHLDIEEETLQNKARVRHKIKSVERILQNIMDENERRHNTTHEE